MEEWEESPHGKEEKQKYGLMCQIILNKYLKYQLVTDSFEN